MTPQAAHPPAPLDDHLCYAIYSAGMAIQRLYKPVLDELGLTYPQYLVMNVLWRDDKQPVGAIAKALALESSTLTPLLKRLETSGYVDRARNPHNERQVIVSLTPAGKALRQKAGAVGGALQHSSDETPTALAELTQQVRELRDNIYGHIEGWDSPL
jgi:DNA-binding MarR family transcriptional regulator